MKLIQPIQRPSAKRTHDAAIPESNDSKLIALTGPQRNSLIDKVANPSVAPGFALAGDRNPNLKVFIAHFDGTWNDMAEVPAGESQTLVAKMFEDSLSVDSDHLDSNYVHGVGTRTSKTKVMLEGVTGIGCEGRAEGMHARMVKTILQWESENPNVEVHVHAIGFSRGAATALHFLNLVHSRGAYSKAEVSPLNPLNMQPGQVKSSAILFDVVATGQESTLTLTVPESTQAILHLTAGGEERRHFAVTTLGDPRYNTKGEPVESLDNPEWAKAIGVVAPLGTTFAADGSFTYQRIQQVNLPGARHSDVGGAYEDGGLARIPEYLARAFQRSLGIPGPTPVRPSVKSIQAARAHDSRDGLELARQALGGMFGRKYDPHDVKRSPARPQNQAWSGDVLRTVQAVMGDAQGRMMASKTYSIVVPYDGKSPFRSAADLSKNKHAIYTPDIKLRSRRESPIESSECGGFEMSKEGRFTFRGTPIDDAGDPDSFLSKMITRQPGTNFVFNITDRRIFCPLQTGNQTPNAGETLDMHLVADAWPDGLIRVIQAVNARGHGNPNSKNQTWPLTATDATELMFQAMRSATLSVGQEFPRVREVQFKLGSNSRDARNNRLKAVDDTGAETTDRKNLILKEDPLLRAHLARMGDALAHVAGLLQDAGFSMDQTQVTMDPADCTPVIAAGFAPDSDSEPNSSNVRRLKPK